MTADYYIADTENGDHVDDPSEDSLFMRITDLARPGNTFLAIKPADVAADWSASVSLLDDGTYEVECRHPAWQEHTRTTSADCGRIARDLTIWLASRFR